MLNFANRPPQGIEDITLSESGHSVLGRNRYMGKAIYRALGGAFYSEFLDAFDGDVEAANEIDLSYTPAMRDATLTLTHYGEDGSYDFSRGIATEQARVSQLVERQAA